MAAPTEKLGSFFLGSEYDLTQKKRLALPLNYDARDLTTHAICVGMTGSGKTGLCIGLLEEAALDMIPAIMIDPKGDLTNLLLQFPDLAPEDFKPWINVDDARRKDMSVEAYAEATSSTWKNGLADWGIGRERLQTLRDSSDYTIYTPGSDAGIPISILGSLAAPAKDPGSGREAFQERISSTVRALLGLAGVKADSVKSREAILLALIFEHFWNEGHDLDLASLILSIQEPPVKQVGVFDLETFFPAEDRFELSMAFNNILASPGFHSWLEGEPLDVGKLLFSDNGKPRQSIFYLAHLPDSERMFFVTLLLENMLGWMRSQAGTTSLRALLYVDEVYGFLPPVAEPPSKRPLMTMLKQARAFGVGCVLVTQNPVDIDYKGLTNAGTWFIGKLQAERDKKRVLEGLTNAIREAGGTTDTTDYDSIITQLGSRVFLLHNVHEDKPVIFHSRWAMSYLRGPLTRPQVRRLMAEKKQDARATETQHPPEASEDGYPDGYLSQRPSLDPAVRQIFLPVRVTADEVLQAVVTDAKAASASLSLLYQPALLGHGDVTFLDKRRNISETSEKKLLLRLCQYSRLPDWDEAQDVSVDLDRLSGTAAAPGQGQGPFFEPVSESISTSRNIRTITKKLEDWLYYNERKPLAVHDELGLFQFPGEQLREFMIRLAQAAREQRDEETDALERKFEATIRRLEKKLRREERELAEDEMEHENRKQQELVGIGETILGFFMGRRSTSKIGTALNKRRMTAKAKADVEESLEEIEDLKKEIEEREAELEAAVDDIRTKWEHVRDSVRTEELAPRRTDVVVHSVSVAWLPLWAVSWEEGAVKKRKLTDAFTRSSERHDQ
ncbi:hypothetical protein INT08_01970 [Prosthecochloris sp. N3]|uniref:Helicase HerA central domain-containing protein n=1 Tax=Prosthecochloris ethylica TaxID=2743976 RepID=A0ABR9XPK4_9CHLB|nr:hypothetical protein [Prosthecochloris ethylica]MBF0586246.1 hypothetical protein [Prosthecochloris ethylica]MBF0635952.1 hypothetical protein [Prosthecochloris ethylica]NUK47373.1 hypothetical protein [Prosthecochloris ethylica]